MIIIGIKKIKDWSCSIKIFSIAGSNSQAIAEVLPATKTEKNTDKNSESENSVVDKEINNQSKPINQIKNIYQEEKSKPEIHKEIKSENLKMFEVLWKSLPTCCLLNQMVKINQH